MKLRYDLEMMNVGDEVVAVPVGKNADELHAMISMNETSKEIIELIKESDTPDEVHKKYCEKHPTEDFNQVGYELCDFLNKLIKEGLLIP